MSKQRVKEFSICPTAHAQTSVPENPLERMMTQETRLAVQVAMNQLSPRIRESVLTLTLQDRLHTIRNAAEELEVAPATIYNRANKGLKILRENLGIHCLD